jgi:hypothetical protein
MITKRIIAVMIYIILVFVMFNQQITPIIAEAKQALINIKEHNNRITSARNL